MAFSYKKYEEPEEVTKKKAKAAEYDNYDENDFENIVTKRNTLNQHMANKPTDWMGGTFGATVNDIANQLRNFKEFSYDLNGDALYQQYKDQYITQGRLAMQDTMGQAAAMTGGYGNSYASTAGNQAYQGYLQKLNDVVPQLYQMAMDKYNMEYDQLNNQYAVTVDQYNREYGEHRDSVADWTDLRNYYTDDLNFERTFTRDGWESDRDFHTGVATTAEQMALDQYWAGRDAAFKSHQQEVAEKQAAQELALKQQELAIRQANASSGGSGGGGGNNGKKVTATQTANTKKLNSYIKTRAEWSRGTDAHYYTNKGMKYEDYVEDVVNQWFQEGKLTEGEALWFFDHYNIK